jgi:Bacterial PH domain
VFTPQDWFSIPFSVVWLGFVLFIFWQGLTKTPEPMGAIMSVLFVGIGTYWLIGRFFVDSFYRSRLVYGVTDRRAIIASGVFSRSVQSIDLSSLSGLKLEERGDGTGTISFGDQVPYWYGRYAGFPTSLAVGNQFFRVADARKVYTVVREATQRQKK